MNSGVCSDEDEIEKTVEVNADLPSGIRGMFSGKDDLMILMADFTQALGDLGIVLGKYTEPIYMASFMDALYCPSKLILTIVGR